MNGQPPSCSQCPLYGKGTGFVLGSGDPKTAKMAVILEAPGNMELIYSVEDPGEITRRNLRYPEMGMKFTSRGAPVVGPSGGILFGWGLAPVQLTRKDLFIDNVLRCLPPKEKNGEHYPTKDVRKAAEAHCRQYDRWDEFRGTGLRCGLCCANLMVHEYQPRFTRPPKTPREKLLVLREAIYCSSERKFKTNENTNKIVLFANVRWEGQPHIPEEETKRVSIQNLRALSETLQTGFLGKEKDPSSSLDECQILFSLVCHEKPERPEVFGLEGWSMLHGGVSKDMGWLRAPASTEKCWSNSLCVRTSFGNGTKVGEIFGTLGVCSPQEWNQRRQSPREPTTNDLFGPSWGSYLPSLPEGIFNSVVCPVCTKRGGIKVTNLVSLINIHPASIAREPTPLPLMIQTFVKAKHFALAGERPLVLCGGKAAHQWMGHASTVQTWLGHYEQETPGTVGARERRREAGMAIKVGEKKVKKKKLTIKAVLEQVVKAAIPFQIQTGDQEWTVGQEVTVRWTEEEYKAILTLLVPKTKKEKK